MICGEIGRKVAQKVKSGTKGGTLNMLVHNVLSVFLKTINFEKKGVRHILIMFIINSLQQNIR